MDTQTIGQMLLAWMLTSVPAGVIVGKCLRKLRKLREQHHDDLPDAPCLTIRDGFGGVEFEMTGSVHSDLIASRGL